MSDVLVKVAEASADLSSRGVLLRAALPDDSFDAYDTAYDALVRATDAAKIRESGSELTKVINAAHAKNNALDRNELLKQAATMVGVRARAFALAGSESLGPIGHQMQDRPEAALFAPKDEAIKARMLTARLLTHLGTPTEPILNHAFFPFFVWITNKVAAQKHYRMVDSDHQQLVRRCAKFVNSAAFSTVDRNVLMGVAATIVDSAQNEPFRFMRIFGPHVAASHSEAARALIQSAWQTVAKVVCFWEACEEQRIYPEVVIDQVMAFLTPFRYCADRPLPESLHKGTYNVPSPSESDSDDVPACADERRVTSPSAGSPAKTLWCNHCGYDGHHQGNCQRKAAGEPKVGRAERNKRAKAVKKQKTGKKQGRK